MLRSSFVTRLMLAMMVTVIIVTCGVLWLMRQRIETSYLRLFEERFRSQNEMFTSMQTMRLRAMRERCRTLAVSAAVVEALQLGSGELPDGILSDLQTRARAVRDSASTYDSRVMAARESVSSSGSAAPSTSSVPRRRQYRPGESTDFVDVALITSLGRVFSLKSGTGQNTSLHWLEDDRISRVPDEQQTGYVMAETPYQFAMPREVILTPVHDPKTGEILGALAVGLPLSDYGEEVLYDLSRPGKPGSITTGLWLEDQLFTSSIPQAEQEALKKEVRSTLGETHAAEAAGGTISTRVRLSGQDYQMMLRPLSTDSALPMAWGVMLSSLAGMAVEQRTLEKEILLASGVALLVALALSFVVSRNLTWPIRSLVTGTRRIREGDYGIRVQVNRRDELGQLGESFNEMAGGLEQRERYHSILVQLSDYEIAQRLIASPALGGERRDVSVLFCDIRGFTAISGRMTPEDVISMLNEHMTALTECVHAHRGVVDKFVGDLIMAVFGAPESTGDHAGNAARCALAMVETRRVLNETTRHSPLEIGTGIASGSCLAGCMGSENRLNYTVLGEPVNLASRLCSAAAPGEILIDPVTASRLDETIPVEPREEQTFKGFSQPIRPYSLTGSGHAIHPPPAGG